MRSLPLILLAVASLLVPAAALASPGTSTPVARYFEIRGLVLGGTRIDASGKLSIDGTQLSASAGCNMIGGQVAVEGNVVTIVGPTYMTEMACPGTNGDAEATLIKILELGKFTITGAAWVADGGQIIAVELVPVDPGAVGSPPDEPVSSSPGAILPAPGTTEGPQASCPPLPSGVNGTTVDGGPISGGGSSSGSTGSTGSGSASAGPGTVEPDATGAPDPGSVPGSEPGATAGVEPVPPAPVPGQSFSLGQPEPEPSFGIILPDPIGQDPNVGKPVDPCYSALGAGQVATDVGVPAKAAAVAAEFAGRDASDRWTAAVPFAFLGLALVAIGAVVLGRRTALARDTATQPAGSEDATRP